MKVKCKETGLTLRDCVWIYQGTDTDGNICAVSDEKMEHHPDPIGWNVFVPEELIKRASGEISTHLAQAMSYQKENVKLKKEIDDLKENLEVKQSLLFDYRTKTVLELNARIAELEKENKDLKNIWQERTDQKNDAEDRADKLSNELSAAKNASIEASAQVASLFKFLNVHKLSFRYKEWLSSRK